MQTTSTLARVTALAFGIAGALAFSHADAAAFQLKENSAKGLGRAFAGSTSAEGDASVIATNPASMRLLEGRQFQADVSAISFSAKFRGDGHYANGAPISGGNGGDAGMIAPVPAMYLHLPFGENDNMHFGTSLTVPFGFKTEYDRDWVGRYSGVKTELQAIDLSAAFSYDVNPYVSFGASVFAERLNVDLTSALDMGTAINASAQQKAAAAALAAGGSPAQAAAAAQQAAQQMAQMGFSPGSADGFLRIKGDKVTYGYTLGTTLTPVEGTNIAFSYRSSVKHKINDGNARFTVPPNAAALLAATAPGTFIDSKGRASITLPASATVSFSHRINDQWSLMADVSRTAWSKFDQVTVQYDSNQPDSVLPFHYRDTTFASVGTEYRMSETLTLRGGLALDQTPTTDAHRDVRVPDTSRKWLSLGLTWTPSERAEYSVGYTHLFTSDPNTHAVSATNNFVDGKYKVGGDVLAASVNYKF
ncbi:outer membrane protein transport protein [Stenotrophomonas mori]|uniref:Outer membrane protein transport protein n=1 Tax=Stenotrophomonas mori TaxID=2871096 RepID=A0ABT0SKN3_9GAMM|nr:outer membrane protein transport protein [Stenotrophomonas mori]MCL7715535.1 outer membrane protein transport protein [Stenotrophomonas mori]